MFSSQPQSTGNSRFANISVNFPQQQPQLQQNQQNQHAQQFPSTSQQQQQMIFQQGASIQNNSTQREPEWFNNPRKRTIPQAIVKRTTKRSPSVDATSTDGDNSTRTGMSGFNSMTFGSKKDVGLVPSSKGASIKKTDHNNSFLDSNEAPPTVSFYDWQREDDFGAIHPLDLQSNDSKLAYESNQSQLSSTPSTIKKNSIEGSETNAFDKKNTTRLDNTQTSINSGNKNDNVKNPTSQESAVIVFGYPESISNLVITHFSKFGKILEDFEVLRNNSGINTATLKLRDNKSNSFRQERKYPIFTGDGWVKLTYSGSAAAVRALQENGRVFGGSLIGCVPYSKDAVEQLASCRIEKIDDIGEMNLPTAQGALGESNGFSDFATRNNNLGQPISDGIEPSSINFNSTVGKPFDSVSNEVVTNSKMGNSTRRLDIKDGKSLFAHSGATNNHNFLQNLEAKMRQQEENNRKQTGILHKVNNWLFGWNEL